MTERDADYLVLDYLRKQRYSKTCDAYRKENRFQSRESTSTEYHDDSLRMLGLLPILEDYVCLKSDAQRRQRCPLCSTCNSTLSELWTAFDRIVQLIKTSSRCTRYASDPLDVMNNHNKGRSRCNTKRLVHDIDSSGSKLLSLATYGPVGHIQKKKLDMTGNSQIPVQTDQATPTKQSNTFEGNAPFQSAENVRRRKKTVAPRHFRGHAHSEPHTGNEIHDENGNLSTLLNLPDKNDTLALLGAKIITNMKKCAEKRFGSSVGTPENQAPHPAVSPIKNPGIAALDVDCLNNVEGRGNLVNMTLDSLLDAERDDNFIPSTENFELDFSELRSLLDLDDLPISPLATSEGCNEEPIANQGSTDPENVVENITSNSATVSCDAVLDDMRKVNPSPRRLSSSSVTVEVVTDPEDCNSRSSCSSMPPKKRFLAQEALTPEKAHFTKTPTKRPPNIAIESTKTCLVIETHTPEKSNAARTPAKPSPNIAVDSTNDRNAGQETAPMLEANNATKEKVGAETLHSVQGGSSQTTSTSTVNCEMTTSRGNCSNEVIASPEPVKLMNVRSCTPDRVNTLLSSPSMHGAQNKHCPPANDGEACGSETSNCTTENEVEHRPQSAEPDAALPVLPNNEPDKSPLTANSQVPQMTPAHELELPTVTAPATTATSAPSVTTTPTVKPVTGSVVINLRNKSNMPLHVPGIVVGSNTPKQSMKDIISQLVSQTSAAINTNKESPISMPDNLALPSSKEKEKAASSTQSHDVVSDNSQGGEGSEGSRENPCTETGNLESDIVSGSELDFNANIPASSPEDERLLPPALVNVNYLGSQTDQEDEDKDGIVNSCVDSTSSSVPCSLESMLQLPPNLGGVSFVDQLEDSNIGGPYMKDEQLASDVSSLFPLAFPKSSTSIAQSAGIMTPPKRKYKNKFSTISPSVGIFSIMEDSVDKPSENPPVVNESLAGVSTNLFGSSELPQQQGVTIPQDGLLTTSTACTPETESAHTTKPGVIMQQENQRNNLPRDSTPCLPIVHSSAGCTSNESMVLQQDAQSTKSLPRVSSRLAANTTPSTSHVSKPSDAVAYTFYSPIVDLLRPPGSETSQVVTSNTIAKRPFGYRQKLSSGRAHRPPNRVFLCSKSDDMVSIRPKRCSVDTINNTVQRVVRRYSFNPSPSVTKELTVMLEPLYIGPQVSFSASEMEKKAEIARRNSSPYKAQKSYRATPMKIPVVMSPCKEKSQPSKTPEVNGVCVDNKAEFVRRNISTPQVVQIRAPTPERGLVDTSPNKGKFAECSKIPEAESAQENEQTEDLTDILNHASLSHEGGQVSGVVSDEGASVQTTFCDPATPDCQNHCPPGPTPLSNNGAEINDSSPSPAKLVIMSSGECDSPVESGSSANETAKTSTASAKTSDEETAEDQGPARSDQIRTVDNVTRRKKRKTLKRKHDGVESDKKAKIRRTTELLKSPVLNWSYEKIQRKLSLIYGNVSGDITDDAKEKTRQKREPEKQDANSSTNLGNLFSGLPSPVKDSNRTKPVVEPVSSPKPPTNQSEVTLPKSVTDNGVSEMKQKTPIKLNFETATGIGSKTNGSPVKSKKRGNLKLRVRFQSARKMKQEKRERAASRKKTSPSKRKSKVKKSTKNNSRQDSHNHNCDDEIDPVVNQTHRHKSTRNNFIRPSLNQQKHKSESDHSQLAESTDNDDYTSSHKSDNEQCSSEQVAEPSLEDDKLVKLRGSIGVGWDVDQAGNFESQSMGANPETLVPEVENPEDGSTPHNKKVSEVQHGMLSRSTDESEAAMNDCGPRFSAEENKKIKNQPNDSRYPLSPPSKQHTISAIDEQGTKNTVNRDTYKKQNEGRFHETLDIPTTPTSGNVYQNSGWQSPESAHRGPIGYQLVKSKSRSSTPKKKDEISGNSPGCHKAASTKNMSLSGKIRTPKQQRRVAKCGSDVIQHNEDQVRATHRNLGTLFEKADSHTQGAISSISKNPERTSKSRTKTWRDRKKTEEATDDMSQNLGDVNNSLGLQTSGGQENADVVERAELQEAVMQILPPAADSNDGFHLPNPGLSQQNNESISENGGSTAGGVEQVSCTGMSKDTERSSEGHDDTHVSNLVRLDRSPPCQGSCVNERTSVPSKRPRRVSLTPVIPSSEDENSKICGTDPVFFSGTLQQKAKNTQKSRGKEDAQRHIPQLLQSPRGHEVGRGNNVEMPGASKGLENKQSTVVMAIGGSLPHEQTSNNGHSEKIVMISQSGFESLPMDGVTPITENGVDNRSELSPADVKCIRSLAENSETEVGQDSAHIESDENKTGTKHRTEHGQSKSNKKRKKHKKPKKINLQELDIEKFLARLNYDDVPG